MVFSQLALMSLAASPAMSFVLLTAWPLSGQRVDPIVNNATVSKHVHHIVGGNAFAPQMNYETTQASTCTSATVSKDLSNYWTAMMYHKNSDGTYTMVPPHGSMSLYYLNEKVRLGQDSKMVAYPKGFRMLAGDPDRRFDDGSVPPDALNFKCLNYGSDPTNSPTIPDKVCKDGIRAEITFPSCWDGVNLDSEDHKSHVAYPTGNFEFGTCPPTHPVHMVVLKSEQIWETFKYQDTGNFVLSTGDDKGYSYHADFLNGWDIDILQELIDTCDNTSGKMSDCAAIASYIPKEQVYLDPGTCKVESFVDEPHGIEGPLAKLPGCNPIGSGPERRDSTGCTDAASLKAGWADVSGDFGPIASAISSGVGAISSAIGGVFPGAGQPAGSGNQFGAPAPSAAPAQFYAKPAAPAAPEGGADTVTEWTYVTKTTTVTGAAPSAAAGWGDAKRDVEDHVHKHRNAHRRHAF